ncbi:hypothetical protein Purlil1_9662 [Purpureocillium lilacinum]|uniref:Uncharacterized protein n=1 Tax=Purpureocillium lilacinum TaxID=33203 RepID=A0ABR0BPQ3_PURLI|nr:hypothetical protein Purlil1_9662 [Purpureocillium lilacinum]
MPSQLENSDPVANEGAAIHITNPDEESGGATPTTVSGDYGHYEGLVDPYALNYDADILADEDGHSQAHDEFDLDGYEDCDFNDYDPRHATGRVDTNVEYDEPSMFVEGHNEELAQGNHTRPVSSEDAQLPRQTLAAKRKRPVEDGGPAPLNLAISNKRRALDNSDEDINMEEEREALEGLAKAMSSPRFENLPRLGQRVSEIHDEVGMVMNRVDRVEEHHVEDLANELEAIKALIFDLEDKLEERLERRLERSTLLMIEDLMSPKLRVQYERQSEMEELLAKHKQDMEDRLAEHSEEIKALLQKHKEHSKLLKIHSEMLADGFGGETTNDVNKNTILGYCSHCHGLVICDVGARADEAVATEASVAARWLNVHRDLSHWITIAARAASRNVQRSVCAWPAAQPSAADAHRYTKTGLCHDRRGPFWGRAPARDSTGRERHSSRDCLPAIFISGRAQVAELGRLMLGP